MIKQHVLHDKTVCLEHLNNQKRREGERETPSHPPGFVVTCYKILTFQDCVTVI